MTSGQSVPARLTTATAVVTAYIALHLTITAGMDLRAHRDLGSSGSVALWWAVAAGVFVVPALRLQRRRPTSTAELVELVDRFAPRQPRWRRPTFLAAGGAGYALFAAGCFVANTAQRQGYTMPVMTQVLLLPTGLAALGAGFLILRYSRPRSARDAARALLADGRAPVLYLRSFAADHASAQVDDMAPLNIHSREEQLASVLGAFGPVIAVGRPGEPLPQLGAARFYLPLDDWQPTILRLMELSRLIVFRLGVGEGLWWELDQALATQPARKLLLLTPDRLADVAELLDERLPVPPRLEELCSDGPWISAAITFGPGWVPHVCPVEPAPGTTTPRRGLVGRAGRALASLSGLSPARRAARVMKAALAYVGVRKRFVVTRADGGMLVTLGKGTLVLAALALPYRALQLAGVW
ncbi:transferase [Embleya sp. NPDC005971]|uniref:transferase n=1 Tax=Embleya sp. NPDC005971 TaxID=3156724 RepID=UPI0033C88063